MFVLLGCIDFVHLFMGGGEAGHVCATTFTKRSKDNLQESVLFPPRGVGDRTLIIVLAANAFT